jgi:hypothetical protein
VVRGEGIEVGQISLKDRGLLLTQRFGASISSREIIKTKQDSAFLFFIAGKVSLKVKDIQSILIE